MEYSLFMIKPCAYLQKDEILKILNENLNVLFTRDVVLDKKFLAKLYKSEENEVYKKINEDYLNEKKACIGIVGGENAISDLIRVCGNKPLGRDCEKNTIRYKYAPKNDILHLKNDEVFYVNAIHKSSPEEAVDQVTVFIKEFLQDEIKKCNIGSKEEIIEER